MTLSAFTGSTTMRLKYSGRWFWLLSNFQVAPPSSERNTPLAFGSCGAPGRLAVSVPPGIDELTPPVQSAPSAMVALFSAALMPASTWTYSVDGCARKIPMAMRP